MDSLNGMFVVGKDEGCARKINVPAAKTTKKYIYAYCCCMCKTEGTNDFQEYPEQATFASAASPPSDPSGSK
jgi:disulfide oxidoreductase YuzD